MGAGLKPPGALPVGLLFNKYVLMLPPVGLGLLWRWRCSSEQGREREARLEGRGWQRAASGSQRGPLGGGGAPAGIRMRGRSFLFHCVMI